MGQALIYPGPPAALVGMPLRGSDAEAVGLVLPLSHMSLTTMHLLPLWEFIGRTRGSIPKRSSSTPSAQPPRLTAAGAVAKASNWATVDSVGLAEVEKLDKHWCERRSRGI